MKKFVVLAAILMVCLFMGCGDSDDNDNDTGQDGGNDTGQDGGTGQYLYFPEMNGGEWSEYDMFGAGRMRYEYFGTDTWENQGCYVIELEMEAEGQKTIYQIWINRQDNDIVLWVMKLAGMVVKMDVSGFSEDIPGTTPDEYLPENATSFEETYETPTGETVKADVFKEDSDEVWLSGEVPFALVQDIVDGEPMLKLSGFAFSGAKRDISKEEIENAIGFGDFPDFPDF